MTMDPHLLREQFTLDIVQKLDLPAVVPHLVEAGLLTRHDQEELMNKHHSQDIRIMQWIEKLVKKGSVGVSKFVDCLERCREAGGHEELIKIMGVAARHNPVQPAMQQAMITGTCTFRIQQQNQILNLPQNCSAQLPMVTSGGKNQSDSSRITGNSQPKVVSKHVQLVSVTELRTKYLTQLIEHLDIVAIAPHLLKAGLLQRHEQEHLLNEHISSQERIMKLAENLGRGGQESVPKFLNCLRKTSSVPGHSILLQIMQSGVQHEGSPITESVMVTARCHVLDPNCFQPYTELITYIENQAQRVSPDELLEIAALFLPGDHLNSLRSGYGSSLTFQSLALHLARIGVCNPIEVDPLIVILTELNQHSLNESILNYARNIQNETVHNFQLSSNNGPWSGFFYLHISHQICPPVTACNVWDLKQNMSLMLMDHSSYRGQFWFRGISVDSTTVVWQFLSTHEQQILRKLIKLHETVNMIQYQNSSGFVSTQFDSRSLTHNESWSLGMTFRLVLRKLVLDIMHLYTFNIGKRSRGDHDHAGVLSLSSSYSDSETKSEYVTKTMRVYYYTNDYMLSYAVLL